MVVPHELLWKKCFRKDTSMVVKMVLARQRELEMNFQTVSVLTNLHLVSSLSNSHLYLKLPLQIVGLEEVDLD